MSSSVSMLGSWATTAWPHLLLRWAATHLRRRRGLSAGCSSITPSATLRVARRWWNLSWRASPFSARKHQPPAQSCTHAADQPSPAPTLLASHSALVSPTLPLTAPGLQGRSASRWHPHWSGCADRARPSCQQRRRAAASGPGAGRGRRRLGASCLLRLGQRWTRSSPAARSVGVAGGGAGACRAAADRRWQRQRQQRWRPWA